MRKITLLLIIITTLSGYSQTYKLKRELTEKDKKEFLGFSKEVFKINFNMSYDFSSIDLKNTLDEIESPTKYDSEYLKDVIDSLKVDPLNSIHLYNLAYYYTQNNQNLLAENNYKEALKNMDIKIFDGDSATFYGYRAIIKYNLNQPNFGEDFEKALKINPTEEISASFYPFYLMNQNKLDEAFLHITRYLDTNPKYKETYTIMHNYLYLFKEFEIGKGNETSEKEILLKKDILSYLENNKYINQIKDEDLKTKIIKLSSVYYFMFKLYLLENNFDEIKDVKDLKINFSKKDLKEIDDIIKWTKKNMNAKKLNLFIGHKTLGILYLLKGDTEKTILNLEKAFAVFPKEKKNVNYNRKSVYEFLRSMYYFSNNEKYEQLILDNIASKAVDIPDDNLILSKYYMEHNDFEKAEKYLNLAENEMVQVSDIYQLKAHLNFMKGTGLMTRYYLSSGFNYVKNETDQFKMLFQNSIYELFKGNVEESYYKLIEIKEKLMNGDCKDCDEIIDYYIEIVD